MDPRLTGLDLKTSLSSLADLVLPRVCVACGRTLLPQERHICLDCLADLPETHFATLGHNPMADRYNARIAGNEYEPYACAAALFHYRADSKYSLITQALKYHRDFGAGKFFARMLGSRLASSELFAGVDLVVPVPLHWSRRWSRGYNQAEIIAAEVARALGAPCDTGLLRRCRRTATQTRISGEAKAANVAGAFRATKNAAGLGKRHWAHSADRRRLHLGRDPGRMPQDPAEGRRNVGAHLRRHPRLCRRIAPLLHRKLPRWSRPAGSIGLRGGSYCRRASSARGSRIAADCKAAPPDGHIIHEQAFLACEGCLWPQAAESSRIANPDNR